VTDQEESPDCGADASQPPWWLSEAERGRWRPLETLRLPALEAPLPDLADD